MQLTRDNYHSTDANQQYMSVSQFKGWADCPARKRAELAGQWEDEDRTALLVGSYVDLALTGTPEELDAWTLAHGGDVFLKSGKAKKAPFVNADAMIAKARNDSLFMEYLTGEHQVILTGMLYDIEWRCMIDVLDIEANRYVDLKTTANMAEYTWSNVHRARVPFYEAFNYWMQLAVYKELIDYNYNVRPEAYIAALSKQEPPDIDIFVFANYDRFQEELACIGRVIDKVIAWKAGDVDAPACGRCAYCRSIKTASVVEAANLPPTPKNAYE